MDFNTYESNFGDMNNNTNIKDNNNKQYFANFMSKMEILDINKINNDYSRMVIPVFHLLRKMSKREKGDNYTTLLNRERERERGASLVYFLWINRRPSTISRRRS